MYFRLRVREAMVLPADEEAIPTPEYINDIKIYAATQSCIVSFIRSTIYKLVALQLISIALVDVYLLLVTQREKCLARVPVLPQVVSKVQPQSAQFAFAD